MAATFQLTPGLPVQIKSLPLSGVSAQPKMIIRSIHMASAGEVVEVMWFDPQATLKTALFPIEFFFDLFEQRDLSQGVSETPSNSKPSNR